MAKMHRINAIRAAGKAVGGKNFARAVKANEAERAKISKTLNAEKIRYEAFMSLPIESKDKNEPH